MQASRLGGFDLPLGPEKSVMAGTQKGKAVQSRYFTLRRSDRSRREHSATVVLESWCDVVLMATASLCLVKNRGAASCARTSQKMKSSGQGFWGSLEKCNKVLLDLLHR